MKISTPLPSALLASLALVIPVCAQDAPANDPQAAPAAAEPNAEVKPYLGLGTCPVPDFLGKHLNLPPNSGIMVRSIDAAGPAAKAGFTVDDVITKVDGKAVASHREMADSFLTKKPGDDVEFDFIHEGKPGKRAVKLGARAAAQAKAGGGDGPEIKVLEGQLNLPGGINGNLGPDLEKRMQAEVEKALKNIGGNQMRIQIVPGGNGGVQIIPGNLQGGIKFRMADGVNMMDEQGSIELKTADGGSEVRVTDKAGQEVWSGPWDTEQDKAAAPPDIRQRIERLNIMHGNQGQAIPDAANGELKLEVKPQQDEPKPAPPAKP